MPKGIGYGKGKKMGGSYGKGKKMPKPKKKK